MARHKEFDREAVLEKAMETFWRYGYEGTSVRDLLESMGINRGSLYDTFGDKRSLFLAAIAHYDNTIVRQIVNRLEGPGASVQAIRDHFYDVIDRATTDPTRRGCFLVNSAVEVCPHDEDTAKRIATNFKRIETAFYKALLRAKEQGEIEGDRDLCALANFLTCTLQGLRVASKINPDREVLGAIVDVALSVLS